MALRFESHVEPIPGYRLIDRLGSGGFGEVWKCEAPGGIFKAVKIIHGDLRSKDNDLVRYAEQELKAMKRVKTVRHPYLLALDRYDIVEGRLLIVMELADCNLWDRFRQCRLNGLPGIGRDDLLNWMDEAAEVLDLMNFEHQLMHLDIKPQNIFLQHNHVKVGDFGQVKDLEGIMASVTGGITPVYAAPETFDGIVTRYCDQYSLACVYQELLTGLRPFDGQSMQQLLMQHLTAAPNLSPSPPADRPALAKALSKKPDDRFANCLELVKALRTGMTAVVESTLPPLAVTQPWASSRTASEVAVAETLGNTGSSVVSFATTGMATTPMPDLVDAPPPRSAPPEQTGLGSLRPALVIGLGGTGLRFLQRFRRQIADRYGSASAAPAVRTLFIDTDPDAISAAMADRSFEGFTAFKPEEVYAARLNRSAHYLKPRQTGRSLVEGWFDPALLHRLPRNPVTMGLRAFGRLALCDHYRPLVQKIEAELDTCLTPEAIDATVQATGQALGSNRPRIYLAASLAGGTGSGMAIDLAYILRNRLRLLGYSAADVVGLLFLPPDDPEAEISPQIRMNVVAALTELNHYSRPGNVFHSFYDDRHSYLRDPEPPFARLMLLPAPLAMAPTTPLAASTPRGAWSGGRSSNLKMKELNRGGPPSTAGRVPRLSNAALTNSGLQRQALRALDDGLPLSTDVDAVATAADWLRLDLFSNLSRAAESVRPPAPPADVPTVATTWGLARFEWPRGEVVARTARIVSGVVLDHWVSPDPGRARDTIPAWTAALWQKVGLDLESFVERLRHSADTALQTPCEDLVTKLGEAVQPKGWLARTPDAAQVGHTLIQWDQLIGHPVASASRDLTPLEEALRVTATDLATVSQAEIADAVPHLIDNPKYRLAGAEEAARQLLADLNRMAAAMGSQADALDAEAADSYESLSAHAHGSRVRGQGTALADALRHYPRTRYKALIARRAARTYIALRESLTVLKNDMAACRQRLVTFKTALRGEIDQPAERPGRREVMPPGCATVEEAAKRFLDVLTDDDLHEIETWVQESIDHGYGGLYQACLNSSEAATDLHDILRDRTRAYLNARLGDVDLAAMFAAKYGPPALVVEALAEARAEAQPSLLNAGPWSRGAITVFSAPPGEGGDPLRDAAFYAFPEPGRTIFADAADEAVVYCEYPQVPLAALPHFGPAWQAAYDSAAETLQCTPHTRTDVTVWTGIDSD